MQHMSITLLPLLVTCLLVVEVQAEPPDTLRLVHVLFRHGDRSPEETFPTDPYQEDAWPQGFGQLTQLGMQQEYKIGQLLRRYYDGFLNSTYIRQEVRVDSTDYDRTLMSSETMLAALYPPSGSQVWNEHIAWQPIPVHTVPKDMDRVMRTSFPCPRYTELRDQAYASDEIKNYEEDNKVMLHTIRVESGLGEDISLVKLLPAVPDPLFSEVQHNMTLPSWVTPEVYDFAMDMKELRMRLFIYDEEMVKLRGGRWVYETLAQMKNYTQGHLDARMKMFLYSGHDTSIAAFLSAMQVYDDRLAPYGSFFMLELHQSNPGAHYFVRVLFKNDTNEDFDNEPRLLEFPGCPDPCSLSDYEKLVGPMLVSSDQEHERLCALDSGALSATRGFHTGTLYLLAILWIAVSSSPLI